MIRPFDIRDLALVLRLREQGVTFHTKSALTNSLHPVRGALYHMFTGGEFPTFVWKAEKGKATGFIQLYLQEGSSHAHILYLSSTKNDGEGSVIDEKVWLSLLDQAVVEAGRRGIQSLVAEVSERGPELPVLRHAGFAVYTRQDIWALNGIENVKSKNTTIHLRSCRAMDNWDIQLLYANTVPRLVQLVEPMPPHCDVNSWILRENGELGAFVHVYDGPAATWLGLFVHPNAEARVDDILTAALQVKSPLPSHPIYCCVRRYQSWIQNALERVGFTYWGSQAVMVKHTVYHTQKPTQDLAAVLEQKGITASTPMVQQYHPQQINGGDKQSRKTPGFKKS